LPVEHPDPSARLPTTQAPVVQLACLQGAFDGGEQVLQALPCVPQKALSFPGWQIDAPPLATSRHPVQHSPFTQRPPLQLVSVLTGGWEHMPLSQRSSVQGVESTQSWHGSPPWPHRLTA
jgi:hypothetical protein